MKKIRTLIVDDEPLAREGLETQLRADPEISIVGQCGDGQAALDAIRTLRPDLVFLDIQMPKRDGFAVLAELKPAERPVIVFATAYDQHAIRAFEVCAIDYLLKPYSDSRFAAALTKAKHEIHQAHSSTLTQKVEELLERVRAMDAARVETPPPPEQAPATTTAPAADYTDRIILKADGALHFIKTRDVIWIEAQGDFVRVQSNGKTQLVRETLQSMEQKLDGTKFLRIHRSYLVNLEHVRKVELALYGDYVVFVSDGSKLRMSRNYRTKLKALVNRTASD
ncbi:MAG: two component transcriptional regulator, LytTR family [Verrucomicrobia bacterium]|nr:two component transcriptional regulator, LytTR family [Verrucomicrobiota bacterium]